MRYCRCLAGPTPSTKYLVFGAWSSSQPDVVALPRYGPRRVGKAIASRALHTAQANPHVVRRNIELHPRVRSPPR